MGCRIAGLGAYPGNYQVNYLVTEWVRGITMQYEPLAVTVILTSQTKETMDE